MRQIKTPNDKIYHLDPGTTLDSKSLYRCECDKIRMSQQSTLLTAQVN
jgi:hypothetical protein